MPNATHPQPLQPTPNPSQEGRRVPNAHISSLYLALVQWGRNNPPDSPARWEHFNFVIRAFWLRRLGPGTKPNGSPLLGFVPQSNLLLAKVKCSQPDSASNPGYIKSG
ncbi:MAG: hypothetical protein F6J93_35225 [Oscillatoria sp. SIO1A7]|nr:hypothetical protein [Oscillatoria sp. SIO1A7]